MLRNRYIVIGFFCVLIGAIMPFLIVLDFLPSTFFLNFLAYGLSTAGLFLGVIGVATYVGKQRRQDDDEWAEY